MRKGIKKQFWLSEKDAADLKQKAESTGLTETALIRLLLRGYAPKERPDMRFYEAMNQLYAISEKLDQLIRKAQSQNYIDTTMLHKEAESWRSFRRDMEIRFIVPDKSHWFEE